MNFLVMLALFAGQQTAPQSAPQKPLPETQALIDALSDANNSAPDIIHNLEAYLARYPETTQRADVEKLLARAAIDIRDDRRTVLYGEFVLSRTPDDMLILDRVARALLATGGRGNAEASLKYSRAFAENIEKAPPAMGIDAARRQDERDRGAARALLYQSRAQAILGNREEAERLAARSFAVFPCEEGAREWATALEAIGKKKEAVERWADAFSIPDSRATDADRREDRRRLAEAYRKLRRSEKGLGDVTLAAFDRTSAAVEARRSKLAAMDPNFGATDPMQFHLSGLDGAELALASLKGNVVVVDFWATWCVPCRTQHPLYEQVLDRFKDRRDVVFLSIDTDEDREVVPGFLERYKWSREVYFDGGLQRLLQVTSIPTTILFDRNGQVASRMNGFLPDKFVDQLTARIRTALAQ